MAASLGGRTIGAAGLARALTVPALVLAPFLAVAETTGTPGAEPLEEIVITGSLIPTTNELTSTPVATITQEDLQNKGYLSLSDALQRQVYSTGGLNNSTQASYANLYTPGAQTLSMFGLPPGYVKYLIDGRPLPDYPALFGGTDVITDIGGIPEDLVDHVDILPGGQSSLYGSDAIAGVVNVVMKKNIDEPVIRARLGGYEHGGGTARRISAAAGHSFDRINVMGGIEYADIDPIWGYQRDLTSQRYAQGVGPPLAELDWLVTSPDGYHYFMDPANCGNVASQFFGSVARYSRADQGDACGTLTAGYDTISNESSATQGYLHATADLADGLQLYAETLLAHGTDKFSSGTAFVTPSEVPGEFVYDPNIGDLVSLQHIFSPEEVGGLGNTLNSATANTERYTLGLAGKFGGSAWGYDVGYTYMEQRLVEETHHLLAQPVYDYFEAILGPELGLDPDGFSIRTPDYAKFYTPVPQSQYQAMDTMARTDSRTENGMLRGQLTNTSLWRLPGGPVGIALAAETGHEEWRYNPDPGYFNGTFYSATAVSGGGDSTRYAFTGELRAPIEPWLSLTGSSRFDSYRVPGNTFSSNTYNVGLELRPVQQLLLRGRVGTAFKAPTLADQFQGPSYGATTVTDYYACAQQGQNVDCEIFYNAGLSTSGNPDLQPIKANVSSIGLVWSPTSHAQLSADYLHWNINDEMTLLDQERLTLTESKCRQGQLDIQSPTCVAALQYVTRDPKTGDIANVYLPKINLANDLINAFVAHGSLDFSLGEHGTLAMEASWNDILTHTIRSYPGDPTINLLTAPEYFGGFKSRIDASVTWTTRQWRNTIYANRVGVQPNLAATQNNGRPDAGSLHPWTVTNLTSRYQWSRHLEIALSVQNLFDVMPPPDHTWGGRATSPYFAGYYDVNGRSYYAQLTYQLGK